MVIVCSINTMNVESSVIRLFPTVSKACESISELSKSYMYRSKIGSTYELKYYKGYYIGKVDKE